MTHFLKIALGVALLAAALSFALPTPTAHAGQSRPMSTCFDDYSQPGYFRNVCGNVSLTVVWCVEGVDCHSGRGLFARTRILAPNEQVAHGAGNNRYRYGGCTGVNTTQPTPGNQGFNCVGFD